MAIVYRQEATSKIDIPRSSTRIIYRGKEATIRKIKYSKSPKAVAPGEDGRDQVVLGTPACLFQRIDLTIVPELG